MGKTLIDHCRTKRGHCALYSRLIIILSSTGLVGVMFSRNSNTRRDKSSVSKLRTPNKVGYGGSDVQCQRKHSIFSRSRWSERTSSSFGGGWACDCWKEFSTSLDISRCRKRETQVGATYEGGSKWECCMAARLISSTTQREQCIGAE